MTEAKADFPRSAVPDQRTAANGRVPAVIGTKPFSWRGDDNTGNMIHAAARRMISSYVDTSGRANGRMRT